MKKLGGDEKGSRKGDSQVKDNNSLCLPPVQPILPPSSPQSEIWKSETHQKIGEKSEGSPAKVRRVLPQQIKKPKNVNLPGKFPRHKAQPKVPWSKCECCPCMDVRVGAILGTSRCQAEGNEHSMVAIRASFQAPATVCTIADGQNTVERKRWIIQDVCLVQE